MTGPYEPIAIVGIGGLFARSPTLELFWANIRDAADTASEPPPGRWYLAPADVFDPRIGTPDHVYSLRGCFIDDFALDPHGLDIDAALLLRLDPLFQIAVHVARQAFGDAVTRDLDRSRVGVVLGNLALPTETTSALARDILGRTFAEQIDADTASSVQTEPLNRYVTGLPGGVIARALGLGGGCWTLDAACASSLYALKFAVDELRAGRADAMLTGGVSRPDSLYTQMGFSQLHALSPSGRASPFAAAADGLVVGEGAGMFVLKRLPDAERDGDRIYGVITGIGLSNDVEGKLLAPSSEGQLRAMRSAYEQASWSPHDIDLIECHATGTPVGDAVEFASLKALWGERGWRPGQCVIGSVKSNVGHTLTAAGSAGLLKLLLALRDRTLAPTANYGEPARGLDFATSPFRVLRQAEAWPASSDRPRRAAVSAFGFGGINAHVLIEEWEPRAVSSVQQTMPSAGSGGAIAVVGMGAHFGRWNSLQAFQERVLGGGTDAQTAPPQHWWGVEQSAWFRAAGLKPEDFRGYYLDQPSVPVERFRIPPRELEEMLPQQLLMLQVAADAMRDAKFRPEVLRRTGVFLGIALDLNTTHFHFRWSLLNQARQWNEQLALNLTDADLKEWVSQLRDAAGPPLTANRTMGALGSVIASRVAREFRLGGPSFTCSSEETSGLHALQTAVRLLQQGELDAAVVGAVDLPGDVRVALTTHSDGTSIGEGAAAVILKREVDARRDGDRIYALVTGIGSAVGGGVDCPPSASAYTSAMRRAATDVGKPHSTVSCLELHGSGDPGEDGVEAEALGQLRLSDDTVCALGSVKADVGHTGAAAGLASFVKTCLCLYQEVLPPLRSTQTLSAKWKGARAFYMPRRAQFWLHNRAEGPRRAAVSGMGVTGQCLHVLLEEAPAEARAATVDRVQPLGPRREALFAVAAADAAGLRHDLERLRRFAENAADDIETLARAWWQQRSDDPHRLAVALVARHPRELHELIASAARRVTDGAMPAQGDRVFYSAQPLGPACDIAFVFPGSGNHFAGMGREVSAEWPGVLRQTAATCQWLRKQMLPEWFWNRDSLDGVVPRDLILGQVTLGVLVSEVVRQFGVQPAAVIGYSLGETAGYFALGAWRDRDEMLQRISASRLFTDDLAGRCEAVRQTWQLGSEESVDWLVGVAAIPAGDVRRVIHGRKRVYVLVVNTPRETVIGGDRMAVERLVRDLGCSFVPLSGISTVHCEVVRPVAAQYRELHLLPTTPPPDVRFYSGTAGKVHGLTRDSAADSILAQALHGMDFPALIEQAYRDGVRVFLEMGPGASCSRMIDAILGGRPHLARSACVAGQDAVSTVLRLLASLVAERVPVDLAPLYQRPTPPTVSSARLVTVPIGGEPFRVPRITPRVAAPAPLLIDEAELLDPLVSQFVTAGEAQGAAHEAYLHFTGQLVATFAHQAALQTALWQQLLAAGERMQATTQARPALDRDQCLEFARGSIARVLGGDFAEVDTFPTRVRLPAEPLMLVDRILSITGEPRSMTSGGVVTEHDIHAGAWYLDCNRIPTCIAVEAGQADLFLSGYLGIDLQTRGVAVYRLLDAVVTFHRDLPGPGEVIHYDIKIEQFFRQGTTYLFRFSFEGTVNGQPLLTMRDGCAGFFTSAELAAGKGIIHTELDRRPRRGIRPEDWRDLVPMQVEAYDERQIESLRHGDLAACFGPAFARLDLGDPVRLPGGRMCLVHRVTTLDPTGGRYGLGLIRAEADIHPDDWFLTCHFVDDRVMPGTLMYECCLHTLRIFLMRLGWVGEREDVVYQPVPGVASRLKCRGQVIEGTRVATYEVSLKEIGYGPEPYAIVDALMFADGKPIVEITDMSLRLSGLDRAKVEALWPAKRVLFDYDRILAFAVGKPSEAFGEPYRIFDHERVIARLPGPPYQFLDRITAINAEPWKLQAGGVIEAEYDVPADAWYFAANRQATMPFAVLLEVALQPCGWLAAYLGSALTSPVDLSFRNLGGQAAQHAVVTPETGTLTTTVTITRVSNSAGMIIQNFDFAVRAGGQLVYQGDTYFGFFTREALANQVGIREARPYSPEARGRVVCFDYPTAAPFPDRQLRMIDRINCYLPDGGPQGLGFIEGSKTIDPDEWFFKAHFYQDPVWPGSLGLEAFLQLLKVVAARRWSDNAGQFEDVALGKRHRWLYRGQVLPTDREVLVQAVVTQVDDAGRLLHADGYLSVDGRVIYQMTDFALRWGPARR
jgi:acyl transferase domain-containing protein/3-hydroxymyristoyl/3-hydroxydecanoyl-(acyl carrier protein) dehydratase